ncbi:Endonuclease V [Legionella beliardensis]|uniref:Endonuclease V n=1 Tax=Legionella beliardensis TaxID=91822 RepID=A0A378ID19_9GAMM|nr:deoxyribonuclease V [Legionella beliardensis]STX30194.1 Endonuclease V [Legionella beliardensis]
MNLKNPENLIINNDFNVQQAIIYQRQWSKEIQIQPLPNSIKYIAGIDIGYDYPSNRAFTVAITLDAESLQVVEVTKAITPIEIPYQPGFLSFREVPALCKALDKLSIKPDLIVCDGQGIAHPRRFGLACHIGLAYDIPTIGCGKSKLYGQAEEPGTSKGSYSYLYDRKGQIIGAVLRTKLKVKPVYISIGHKAELAGALEWILKLTKGYRLPEPTRLADKLAHEHKLASLALPT